jgi:thiamine-monophosphate kinase
LSLTISSLGERALIQRITARLTMPAWVVVGPGDDAAVLKPERGALDVLTTDTLVDGVHFDRRFVPPDAIGHRALAVNLSDLAAMGAEPRAALLSLVLPDAIDVSDIDALVDGLVTLAAAHRVTLVGGNITRTPGPLVIDVTATGTVRPRRILRRSGARPGDDVYVTGSIGEAAVGLRVLQLGELDDRGANPSGSPGEPERLAPRDLAHDGPAAHDLRTCVERYLRPQPRVRAGMLLGRARAASSAMDSSDGLADAVRQISEASDVGMRIDASALPLSEAVRAWSAAHGVDAVDLAVAGGDDYELLFTARPTHRGRLRHVRQFVGDLPITKIGTVTRDRAVVIVDGHRARELPQGYEHFR